MERKKPERINSTQQLLSSLVGQTPEKAAELAGWAGFATVEVPAPGKQDRIFLRVDPSTGLVADASLYAVLA